MPGSFTPGLSPFLEEDELPEGEGELSAADIRAIKRANSKREKELTAFYFSIGLLAMRFGGPADGAVFLATQEPAQGGDGLNNAQRLAKSVARYAEVNPSFAAFVDTLLERSALATMLSMHAMVATALLQNHGIVPGDVMKAASQRVLSRFKTTRPVQHTADSAQSQ
jgi:hypothetical protein